MSCSFGEVYDKNSAYYLRNHTNLHWVSANIITMLQIPNAVTVNGGLWPFMFGRTLINGRYLLGKVHTGNGAFGFFTFTIDGEAYMTANYEVLACKIPSTCSC